MSAVDRLLDSYLDLLWHFDPAAASAAGVVSADGRLGQFDALAMRQHLAAFRALASGLEDLEVDALEDEIDRTALLDQIRTIIARFEQDRPHVRDPGFWLEHVAHSLAALLLRGAEPRSVAQAVLARIAAIPSFLDAAGATIRRPPAILADRGLGLLGPTGELLVQAGVVFAQDSPGTEALQGAIGPALQALKRFGAKLRDEIEPDPDPRAAALGEDRLDRRLHHEHALPAGSAELWRAVQRDRTQLEARLAAEAEALAPARAWRDVVAALYEERSTHAVPLLREAIERARRFASDHELVPPVTTPLEVVETPAYVNWLLREPAYFPGAATPSGTARLFVGAGLALGEIPAIAVREGNPGRHLRAVTRETASSAVRRALTAPAMMDGWPLYAEQLMEEAGSFADAEDRVITLARRLEALAMLAVDLGLHAQGMTPAEAATLLVEWTPIGRDRAELVVRRAAAYPARLLAAEAGRRELVRLREAAGATLDDQPALRRFHETVLAYGGVAPRLVGWGMGLG